MTVSENFIEFVLDQLSQLDGISTRKMFGGLAIYQYRVIFALISDDMVYLKVYKTTIEKYLQADSKPLQPFPNRPAVKSYYEVPVDILEDSEKFTKWVEESLFAQKEK
ncbi:TfoX/Sxy family protein [Poseidonibacter antarcticus]|uniref:TfoX/Sxy family protein n=1 Tax=Poseidonibacter antarcticus TaxID=2478538 RepID=UPI000EF544EF|nr:TfoX/Sxy family protein [Poseidonibacter antarcticus]